MEELTQEEKIFIMFNLMNKRVEYYTDYNLWAKEIEIISKILTKIKLY